MSVKVPCTAAGHVGREQTPLPRALRSRRGGGRSWGAGGVRGPAACAQMAAWGAVVVSGGSCLWTESPCWYRRAPTTGEAFSLVPPS